MKLTRIINVYFTILGKMGGLLINKVCFRFTLVGEFYGGSSCCDRTDFKLYVGGVGSNFQLGFVAEGTIDLIVRNVCVSIGIACVYRCAGNVELLTVSGDNYLGYLCELTCIEWAVL